MIDIEIIIGLYKDPVKTPLEQIRDLAVLGQQFWTTTNPEAEIVEGFLPLINTPAIYQASVDVLWLRCRMPEDYALAFQAVYDAQQAAYAAVFHDVIFMFPIPVLENGVAIGVECPAEPEWTEPIFAEDGVTVIGTRVCKVGRII